MAAAIANNLPDAQPTSTRRLAHVVKRRQQRETATRRLLRRVMVPIPTTRKPDDPTDSSQRSQSGWVLAAIVYVGLALLLHVVGVGVALLAAKLNIVQQNPDEQVTIELIEIEPPSVATPAVPEPEAREVAKPVVPVVAKVEPKAAEPVELPPDPMTPSPEPVPPPTVRDEPPQQSPLRVVGLSLDSTMVGGGGPSFAVGNTRMGDTAGRAVDPTAVEPIATPGASANRAASRIPVAGVIFTKPERKTNLPPPYPDLLRQQGIEAEVVVVVSIDTRGKVSGVTIAKGSTYPEFNEAAKAAALAEEFTPATKNGEAVPYSLKYTYFFRLTET